MQLRSIKNVEVKDKKVLVRVDYNVPVKNGVAADHERIISSAETVKWLLSHGATVVLCSHFGRPDAHGSTSLTTRKNKEYSLKFIVPAVEEIVGHKVIFVNDCIGAERAKVIDSAGPSSLILLENVRFYEGEEKNEEHFAQKLSENFDLFVNDAFSASHRAHASVVGVAKFLPTYAGFSLEKEALFLAKALEKPERPFVVVSGGAKISDKIDILKGLIEKSDVLMIGGAMANTFLAAEGYDVGKSLYEPDFESSAEEIKRLCEDHGVELILPDDVMTTKTLSEGASVSDKPIDEVEKNDYIVDIGKNTVAKFAEPLKFAGSVFWNGPMGIAEHKNARGGTIGVAKIIAGTKATSIIGGGDTIAAVKELDLNFDFISTGGGATLEMLSGKKLPGLEVLLK
jgi:phosphoglycerate kinase